MCLTDFDYTIHEYTIENMTLVLLFVVYTNWPLYKRPLWLPGLKRDRGLNILTNVEGDFFTKICFFDRIFSIIPSASKFWKQINKQKLFLTYLLVEW